MSFQDWKFKKESGFKPVPEGTHRVRIADVDLTESKSGNDMIKIKLDVSGEKSSLFHYIVFLPDRPEITNRNLTQLFESFDIPEGEFNFGQWVGKAGACTVKHDDMGYAKVGYFLKKDKQNDLPPWKASGNPVQTPFGVGTEVIDKDIPF